MTNRELRRYKKRSTMTTKPIYEMPVEISQFIPESKMKSSESISDDLPTKKTLKKHSRKSLVVRGHTLNRTVSPFASVDEFIKNATIVDDSNIEENKKYCEVYIVNNDFKKVIQFLRTYELKKVMKKHNNDDYHTHDIDSMFDIYKEHGKLINTFSRYDRTRYKFDDEPFKVTQRKMEMFLKRHQSSLDCSSFEKIYYRYTNLHDYFSVRALTKMIDELVDTEAMILVQRDDMQKTPGNWWCTKSYIHALANYIPFKSQTVYYINLSSNRLIVLIENN